MAARGHVEKASLTPREKLKVAHAHLIFGVSQHTLAGLFEVNPGRISEAIMDVKSVLDWQKTEEAIDE